jgi:hypothetical protein
VFAAGATHEIHLRVSAEGWRLMEPISGSRAARGAKPSDGEKKQPYVEGERVPVGPVGLAYAYAKAQVEWDGVVAAEEAGVRFKGNISYVASRGGPRRPMKLDFDRFVEKGRFAGLATINLNNSAFDPSHAREALGYAVMRELGVPAPRTGWALVYLTVPGAYEREFLGLYALVEEVDDRFLKKRFADDGGLLLKPEGVRGLAYFGEDWALYERRLNPKSKVEPKQARRVIELARLINRAGDGEFRAKVESYLAVDGFLRYVAANAAIANLDSFLSTGHNYYLYVDPADGRAHVVPWDLNLAFGGYSWVASATASADTPIMRPYVDRNILVERLLAVPEHREAYRGYLRRACEMLGAERVAAWRAREIEPVLAAAGRAAKVAGREGRPSTRPATGMRLDAPELWSWVAARAKSMRAQLDGGRPGTAPNFFEPELVPEGLSKAAGVGRAMMAMVDGDGDGFLAEAEVQAGVRRLWAAAGMMEDEGMDRASAERVMERVLSERVRERAPADAWAKWVFRVADLNGDKQVMGEEVVRAWRRMLGGSDRDYDGVMGGRELVESLAGAGVP